jgi:SAM-dependent methyltransferase
MASQELYAHARQISDVTECSFYHAMDLPGIGTVTGIWDLQGRIQEYIGGIPVAGRRVLDLGAANGFCSFEVEKLGGQVVSFDADSATRFEHLPIPGAQFTEDYDSWLATNERLLEKLKNAYWLAHRLHRSSARVYYGDIYHLPDALGMFDIVLVGQVLVHLRDPIAALRQAAARCSDTLVITEAVADTDQPVMRLCGTVANGVSYAWFHLSCAFYREILLMLGFDLVQISQAEYKCSYSGYPESVPLTTLVARRKSLAP